jgi:prepilin-type N-terminal cleavage/methylation domain-containing protein
MFVKNSYNPIDMSMKSKLNRRQGFTIAEIIIAVAIMAALVAVLMRGLQSSRKSIQRDVYRLALRERASLIRGRIQAMKLEGAAPTADLGNLELTSEEKKDPFGTDYSLSYDSKKEEFTITPAPKGSLAAAGVTAETFRVEE